MGKKSRWHHHFNVEIDPAIKVCIDQLFQYAKLAFARERNTNPVNGLANQLNQSMKNYVISKYATGTASIVLPQTWTELQTVFRNVLQRTGKKTYRPDVIQLFYDGMVVATGYLAKHPQKTEEIQLLYVDTLEKISKNQMDEFQKNTGTHVEPMKILKQFSGVSAHMRRFGLLETYRILIMPDHIRRELNDLVQVEPRAEYPRALAMERHFIVHVGETNTGKTYDALARLVQGRTGVYLAPLRLLAMEVQEKLCGRGISCGLLTGEEESGTPQDTHISSTVEKLDLEAVYDVAVIDECQMLEDSMRGHMWVQAILGCLAREIHCCVAPEGLEILRKIIAHGGCTYEIIHHKRAVPLVCQSEPVGLAEAKAGDAFIAFSRKGVLKLASEFEAHGHSVSVIYGALPYGARRLQVARFLRGESQIVIATDAIGMGLNLPIHRIVFTTAEKYDGTTIRPLTSGEVRQVAGRAGRQGMYEEGFVATASSDFSVAHRLQHMAPSVQKATLGFPESILNLDYDLEDILRIWQSIPAEPPFYKMSVKRHLDVLKRMKMADLQLSKDDQLRTTKVMFNEQSPDLWCGFLEFLQLFTEEAPIPMPTCPQKINLEKMEQFYQKLDLYFSFCKQFDLDYDRDALYAEKQLVTETIHTLLLDSFVGENEES